MDVTPANQKLTFTISTGPAIQPNSVELKIPLQSSEGITGSVTLTDVPVNATMGNLVNSRGQVQGTIIYATGAVEVTPKVQRADLCKPLHLWLPMRLPSEEICLFILHKRQIFKANRLS